MITRQVQISMPRKRISEQLLLLLTLVVTGTLFLFDYVVSDLSSFILGISAVVVTSYGQPLKTNRRYAIAAFIVWLLTLLVPVKTLLFFVWAFTFFFWLETYYARVGFLGLTSIIVCSPIFHYVINVFSFPIRLQLTSWVSNIFSFWQSDITTKGNVIFHKGYEFAVDPACMGLHMLSISVLLGILLVGILQRKAGKILSWKLCIAYITCIFLLNIIANLIRIILLVQFTILPGTIMHEITGLLCLVIYVCLPAAYLAKYLIVKHGRDVNDQVQGHQKPQRILLYILLAGLIFSSFRTSFTDTYQEFENIEKRKVKGYTSSLNSPGILKLENPETLIYIKFIRGFYDTDHNPTMCWKGSGYEFKNIKTQRLGNFEVFTALLTRGKDKLYTAWWYSNSNNHSTNQWEWRWDMLRGATNYAVVNITKTNENALYEEVKHIVKQGTLKTLFQKNN